jgi:putative membrane protein
VRVCRVCATISRMLGILLRLVCSAAAVFLITLIGIGVDFGPEASTGGKVGTAFAVAIVLGLVNAFLKPLIKFVGCGLYVLTLGLVSLVVNGFLFWLSGVIVRAIGLQFNVNFWPGAIVGALLISIVSFTLGLVIKDRGEK